MCAPSSPNAFSRHVRRQAGGGRLSVAPQRCAACHERCERANQCSRCKTIYCDAACQKRHWKLGGHKVECAAIARVGLERHAADVAAVVAAADCHVKLAAASGSACGVCGGRDGAIVTTCGACGTTAHVRCLARRTAMPGTAPVEWYACATCAAPFPAVLFLALARDHWRGHARGRDDDWNRVRALSVLGNALAANDLDDEALPCREADLYYCQTYFADDERSVLDAQANLAACYSALGRHDEALVFVHMIYEAAARAYGGEDERSLRAAFNLANALGRAGQAPEEQMLLRTNHAAARRALGRAHDLTIDLGHCLAQSLMDSPVAPGDKRAFALRSLEAAGVLEECLAASRDKNGAEHATTRDLRSDLDDARSSLAPTQRLFASMVMVS